MVVDPELQVSAVPVPHVGPGSGRLQARPEVLVWIDRAWVRLALAIAITVGFTTAIWLLLGLPNWGIDDADITRVYGRHLAAGHGLVFTPGFEHVEGFSSPAWMLVWAFGYALAASPDSILPLAMASGLCVLLCALSVTALLSIVRRLTDGRGAWVVAAALLALSPGFFAWNTLTLMDLGLWTACIAAYLWIMAGDLLPQIHRRSRWPLALVLAGMVWIRPEGILLGPVLLGLAVCARYWISGGQRPSLRPYALPLGAIVLSIVSLLGLRFALFGHPWPNTYYAKVSTDRLYNFQQGLDYWIKALSTPWIALCAPLAVGVWVHGIRTRFRTKSHELVFATLAASLALIGFALPIIEGGDHFGAQRLLQPFFIPAAVPVFYLLGRVRNKLPLETRKSLWPSIPVMATVLLALGAGAWLQFRMKADLEREFLVAKHGRQLGSAMTAAFPAHARPSVGVVSAGGIALQYEGRVLDLMGLNWTAMAHSPGQRYGLKNHAAFDPEVFWTAPPVLVAPRLMGRRPRPHELPTTEFNAGILKDLLQSERFQSAYTPRAIPCPGGFLFAYAAKSWNPILSDSKP